jgi:nicotine blue oxidoreductase
VIAGIVLAAGAGTRYGMPKALADNGAWLRSAVAALREGGCAPVIVVLGATGPTPDIVALPADARHVWAADWARGMSASLRAGLAAAVETPAQFAAIMPVDTPDVRGDAVARVVAAAIESPSGLARAAFGSRPGHPVVAARRHWAAMSAAAHGDSGAREYLGQRTDVTAVRCDDLAGGADRDYPDLT